MTSPTRGAATDPPRIGPAVIQAAWLASTPLFVVQTAARAGEDEEDDDAPHGPEGRRQRALLQRAYAAMDLGHVEEARRSFEAAAAGAEPELSARARSELANLLLDDAYGRKDRGDLAGAIAGFERARSAGADPQRIDAELGSLAAERGRVREASERLSRASRGSDPEVARAAREELRALPRHGWLELYAESVGWRRLAGPDRGADVVPSTRLRALYRPWLDLDLNLFLGVLLSRDFTGTTGPEAVPRTDADGAMLAGGVLLRTWQNRLELLVQAGPATHLSAGARRGVELDFRAGAALFVESDGCWPAPGSGVSVRWRPCADTWSEAFFVSRFAQDVGALWRGRAGGSLVVAGPIAFGPTLEARAALDRHGELYGNLAEAGLGMRLKVLRPWHVDVVATLNHGTRLGLTHPVAPGPSTYTDLRLQAATYLEL